MNAEIAGEVPRRVVVHVDGRSESSSAQRRCHVSGNDHIGHIELAHLGFTLIRIIRVVVVSIRVLVEFDDSRVLVPTPLNTVGYAHLEFHSKCKWCCKWCSHGNGGVLLDGLR